MDKLRVLQMRLEEVNQQLSYFKNKQMSAEDKTIEKYLKKKKQALLRILERQH